MQPFVLERYFAKYEFSTRYSLSSSDCESLTSRELLDMADDHSRQLWEELALGYTENRGHPLLLQQIAAHYRTIAPGNLLVAAPEELIFLAMNALLKKEDEVIVTAPAYQSLYELAASLGCRVFKWELQPSTTGWSLDLGFLANHLSDRTKIIIINFPHNPTGHHITRDQQREMIGLARKFNVTIFSDEMYRGAEYEDRDQLPAMVDEYERGVSLSGLSKSFSLPGLRIGWLASKDAEVIARCIHLKDFTTICNSAPSEILAIIALNGRERILRRTREILLRNLALADSFFSRHKAEFSWLRPRAASIAFPLLKKDIPVEQFCTDLAERKSLLLAPGSLFQFPGNHFRLGLGRNNFQEALGILEESL